MSTPSLLGELNRLIGEVPMEELPRVLGALVEAEERARLRLRLEASNGHRPEPEDRNLSAKEAARRLGVSLPYLYKHADEYPFTVKIGKRVLFASRALEAWNRGQR